MIELLSEEKITSPDYLRIKYDFYELWTKLFVNRSEIDRALFRRFGRLWPLGRLMSETVAFAKGMLPRTIIPWFIPQLAGIPLCADVILYSNQLWMPRCWEYPWAILNSAISPESRILDVGSGWGLFPLYLAQRSNHIDSVDTNELQMKVLAPVLADILQVRVNYLVGDALDLPAADNTYDYVYCISVLEHLEEEKENGVVINRHTSKLERAAIREFIRVIRPGGRIILTLDYADTHSSPRSFGFAYVKDLIAEFSGNLLKPLDNIDEIELTEAKERELRKLWAEYFPYDATRAPAAALGIILTKA